MSLFIGESQDAPYEVVVAGAGVAGLETVLALHDLAGPRVRVRLVAPNSEFSDPALSVAEPFGLASPRRFDIAELARRYGAIHRADGIVAVDAERHTVLTRSTEELDYDALVLATGARRRPALRGALTFGAADSVDEMRDLLAALADGAVARIAFAVPRAVAWPLPAYELALLTARYAASHGVRDAELSVVTSERTPLAVFGRRAADRVAALLREAGIALRMAAPESVHGGDLMLAGGDRMAVDAVVSLPRPDPVPIVGVPATAGGFIPVDRHGRVEGLDDVYAAGDATSYPVNQGGIAAQQADAVAHSIAAAAGAPVASRAFRPVLRGALLTGAGVEYMRRRPNSSDAEPSDGALWWPAAKVAARYLGPLLARGPADEGSSTLGDVGAWHRASERDALGMALDFADADARSADYAAALRWLDVAEQVAIVLPEDYVDKRERWRDALAGVA